MWLKSYGMMVHTDPGNLAYHKIDSEKLEAHKAAGTPMLYCSLTAMYSCHWKEKRIKFFLPTKKGRVPFPTCSSNISRIAKSQLCLTSMNTGGARDQIVRALKTHCIERVVVLGASSLFDSFAEYESWVFEIDFIEQREERNNTRLPKLIFQDLGHCGADHRPLNDLGAGVVEHPKVFTDHIDSKTLVFARHLLHTVSIYSLLPTSPAVCLMTIGPPVQKVEQSVGGVENFRGCKDFDPDFDTSGVAKIFITNRKQVELSEALIPRCREGPT
ncbi:hypothetical protein D6C99_10486 [Aureobasidium pullulans]|nr:hypothetical protein D6C99_10486 [Aureobasidium pullulans]